MEKKGLIIGIDYTGQYCQASYYSRRHKRTESITYGGETVRYLIPTALSYDHENKDWIIGQPAIEYAEKTGESVYRNLLENVFLENACVVGGQRYSYTQLLAIFVGKIIELTQIATSIMGIENITINLRRITSEVRQAMQNVIRLLQLPPDKVKLQTCAESFAYYIWNEKEDLTDGGAILFDFTSDGFFEKFLTGASSNGKEMILVHEQVHTQGFSMGDMGNGVLMEQMDDRLLARYEEICSDNRISSVYFTGEGFQTMWFGNTLRKVSEKSRAFKGNNLYAKGACLAGLYRSEKENAPSILCAGRTKCTIAIEVKHKGEPILMNLSKAPADWYDAGMKMDLILDNDDYIRFFVISLKGNRSSFDIDVSKIPKRAKKATRIELNLQFFNENECEITIRDKGFGGFYESSGFSVSRRYDLTQYIS